VAGSCKYSDEPEGSGIMELVSSTHKVPHSTVVIPYVSGIPENFQGPETGTSSIDWAQQSRCVYT
jgi:hypothetical protein